MATWHARLQITIIKSNFFATVEAITEQKNTTRWISKGTFLAKIETFDIIY